MKKNIHMADLPPVPPPLVYHIWTIKYLKLELNHANLAKSVDAVLLTIINYTG